MHTHTIRNKSKPTPVVTLTPQFFARLLASRPDAVSLTWGRFVKKYKELTGKTPMMNYEQHQALLRHAGADADGVWTSALSALPKPIFLIRMLFEQGFMFEPIQNLSFEESLVVSNFFYSMLEDQLESKEGCDDKT